MNATVLYSLQTIISAGIFIFIYRLFVRNTNAYNWNRFYLLATMIISLFLPHINISGWFKSEEPVIFYGSLIDFDQTVTISPVPQIQNTFSLSDLVMTLYWLVAVFLLLRFGWGIMRILELAKNDDYQKSGNLRLYPIHRKTTFSFFNWIFIQPQHWEKPTIDYIIRHEQAHVKQMHTLDNLLTELLLVFGWFNPFYYIYRRDLHLLHECQADQVVINSDCDATTYHQLLLNEVSGNLTYIIVNQFSYSLIKRRFKMISKNKQSRLAGFRILLAIPTAFALMMLFSFTSLEKTTNILSNKIVQPTMEAVQSSLDNLQDPQQKPAAKPQEKKTIKFIPPVFAKDGIEVLNTKILDTYYPGGHTAWWNFIEKNYTFSKESRTKKAEGEMIVLFKVSENGAILNTKINMGLRSDLDKEAINVFSKMPKWKPLIKSGKPVSVNYQAPLFIKIDPAAHSSQLSLKPFSQITDPKDLPLTVVEQNPDFKGGYSALQQFLKKNIIYPDVAKKQGIQGTVFASFIVSKFGKISNVKILRGIGGGCDEEAIRVIKMMPDWIPGRNEGKEVAVYFQIPVKFQLNTSAYVVKTNTENQIIKQMTDKDGNPVYLTVEQNPEFQGGYEGFQKYIKEKMVYPASAQHSGIQGTVFISFIVDKSGQISDAKILRGIGSGCDEEALRLIKEMPRWIPGKQNGQAVSVQYQIPVKFQLAK